MSLNSIDFSLFLAEKLQIDTKFVSTQVLKKIAKSKKQKEIIGHPTITKGGRVISLYPEKKLDAKTHGGKSQFEPITNNTDFVRIYLPTRPKRIPEFLVIDLDENDENQLADLIKIIPEASETLVTRTSKRHKMHVWFRYPQPTNNEEYIIQSRGTKCPLIPGYSNTDIFTVGILFEGYLTTRKLDNSKREKPDYRYCVVQDKDAQELSTTSIQKILSVLNQEKAKRRINSTTKYSTFSNSMLAATMRQYIKSTGVVQTYDKDNTHTHITEEDIMYIYNTLFNPAIYAYDTAETNPFADNTPSTDTPEKLVSLYYKEDNKVVTKDINKLPKQPSRYNSICMPLVAGNWEYYNSTSLKVHSQDRLTFDERQEFIVKWLEEFVLPGVVNKNITIQGYLDHYWSEFGPGDVPYNEPITSIDVSDKPKELDDYLFGDYSMSGNYIYVPTLVTRLGMSKTKLTQVDINTEEVKCTADGELIYHDIKDIVEKLERTAIQQKRIETQAELTKNTIASIKKDVDDWKGNILVVEPTQVVNRFEFGKYDTVFYDEALGSPVINKLRATPALSVTKYKDDILDRIVNNPIFKQVWLTLPSNYSLRASTGEKLELVDGTIVSPAVYYCMMLAYTLFNPKAPLGRYIMHGEGRTGKTRLAATIPGLLFPKETIATATEDNYKGTFTLDYSLIRVVILNEIGYDSMSNKDKKAFAETLKAVTEYGGIVRKELKNQNATSQEVNVLTLETTNGIPHIPQDDTRIIVVETQKSTDLELVTALHNTLNTLTPSSPEVLEFAEYLRMLYDTNINNNTLLHLALTMNAPITEHKMSLQLQSVNNTEQLHDMLLVTGSLNALDEHRDGSDYLNKHIDFLLDRKPIVYRPDVGRIVIHMNDLRLLYWILSSKKDDMEYMVEGALDKNHENYGNFGKKVHKGSLRHALKTSKIYDIDLLPANSQNMYVKLYDKLTGLYELRRATDRKIRSHYVAIVPTSQLKYNIENGLATHTSVAEVEGDIDE
jgi:hypothetical protein